MGIFNIYYYVFIIFLIYICCVSGFLIILTNIRVMELSKFINLFTGILNLDKVDKIDKDTRFKDLKHWNAFCTLSLIVFVDVNFDKCINKNEIERCDTVESLYTFIENK